MSVEGIPQREEVVTFTKHFLSYNPGEVAGFTPEEAALLNDQGVIEPPVVEPPPLASTANHHHRDKHERHR